MVICLERGANDFAYGPAGATGSPSSLAPVKSRMVYLSGAGLPRLSWKKRPLNGCSVVVVSFLQQCAKLLAGKNASVVTYFMSSGILNLKSVSWRDGLKVTTYVPWKVKSLVQKRMRLILHPVSERSTQQFCTDDLDPQGTQLTEVHQKKTVIKP